MTQFSKASQSLQRISKSTITIYNLNKKKVQT